MLVRALLDCPLRALTGHKGEGLTEVSPFAASLFLFAQKASVWWDDVPR